MQNDMTKGSPLRLIVLFTLPVLIGNLFQNFYNLVDSVIVGRFLGVNALAAVGATGTIAFLIFGWINGITGGFGIMLAQSFGAGDEKHLRHYTAMSVYLCTAMAVLMAGGLLLANGWILKAMNTPDSIFEDTKSYIGIVYAGIPITIAYNMLASISRSMGDSQNTVDFSGDFFGAEYCFGSGVCGSAAHGRGRSGLCYCSGTGGFRSGLLLLCAEKV